MAEHSEQISTLNTLIATTIDSITGYEDSAQNIDSESFREMFRQRSSVAISRSARATTRSASSSTAWKQATARRSSDDRRPSLGVGTGRSHGQRDCPGCRLTQSLVQ